MAQSWRVKAEPQRNPRLPLDSEGLERLGLGYAGRYATTRAKLEAYLRRKVRERGWAEPGLPPYERLVERFAALGYVDDRAFASAKASSLLRRGYGERRVREALQAAGIAEEDSAPARDEAGEQAFAAALRFAERRRLGPYAAAVPDRPQRDKAMAAMLRAGHRADLVRRILAAPPGEVPDPDSF
jgi:regulatory protein